MPDAGLKTTQNEAVMDRWEVFERSRPRLQRVAARIVGSVDDADDIVQETSLRWMRADLAAVRAPEGWMITVVTRLAVDHVRRATRQRRIYREAVDWDGVGDLAGGEPVEPAESRTAEAFFVLRSNLAPAERIAFMLREVFGCEYADVARELRKSEVACRQIVHRARSRLQRPVRRIAVEEDQPEELAERFASAVEKGDREVAIATLNHRADETPHTDVEHPRPFVPPFDRSLHSAA